MSMEKRNGDSKCRKKGKIINEGLLKIEIEPNPCVYSNFVNNKHWKMINIPNTYKAWDIESWEHGTHKIENIEMSKVENYRHIESRIKKKPFKSRHVENKKLWH